MFCNSMLNQSSDQTMSRSSQKQSYIWCLITQSIKEKNQKNCWLCQTFPRLSMNAIIILKQFTTDALYKLESIHFTMEIITKFNNFSLKFVVTVKTEIKLRKLSDNFWLKDTLDQALKKIFLKIRFYLIIYTWMLN